MHNFKTIWHFECFQGYCGLSNDLQMWKHTRNPSFLAPFYREKWPNARKTRGIKQWINAQTCINKREKRNDKWLPTYRRYLTCLPLKWAAQTDANCVIGAMITLSWTEKWGAYLTHVLSLSWWLLNWQSLRWRKRWRHNPDFIVRQHK